MDPPTEYLDASTIRDRKVCVTGRLIFMSHDELADLVHAGGGTFVRFPKRSSLLVVLGADGWPAERDGSPTRIVKRARELKALGYAIDFVDEDDFLERLGLFEPAQAIRGRHTISDLSRILGVSGARIRRWVRAGLIEPEASPHPLARFDFHHVAFAKRVVELVDAGTQLSKIRRGMEQVHDMLGTAWGKSCLDHLARIERDGRILMRVRDRLIDNQGQSYFNFDDGGRSTVPAAARPIHSAAGNADELFDAALALEDAGQLVEAVQAYQRAIERAPTDPLLHFNLGNVLCELERFAESVVSYECAVEHDPRLAEAWNNLGNVYADLGRPDESIGALRNAIQLVPTYADAHYNLAAVMEKVGRVSESDHHYAVYRQYSTADRLLADREYLLRVIHEAIEPREST